jgi:hypothetical protein
MNNDGGLGDSLGLGTRRESYMGNVLKDSIHVQGWVDLYLYKEDGSLKQHRQVHNLITDAGDLYYAQKAITGISPATPSAPTAVSGMKLGTGTTAAAKNGAGAALVTYIAASNNPFDATYPSTNNLGAGHGVQARYVTTWAAGDVTNSAITEIVIVNDAAVDATSTAGNTISRAVFSAINKTASDTLVATWNHLFKGA